MYRGMKMIKSSHQARTTLRKLLSAIKTSRRQVTVVAVISLLSLAVILNVAMAPVTNAENALSQVAYLKKDINGTISIIR
jgi:hypothetical protein|tara:strand:+ start:9301 stop:9540 length:240 start_codon:yes stop_codon:yes gene_type:complete